MATTYTLKSNSYDGRLMTLTCTQTPNLANNTSTISWTLTVSGGASNYYSTGPTTVTIGGTQVYYKDRVSYSAQTFPAAKGSTSGSLTVNHSSDGSKSLAVSLSTAIYTSTVSTASGTWTLDKIGRASTATCTSGYIGDTATCTISAANTSYTHTVSFTCLGETYSIGSGLKGGANRFTIPNSLYDTFGNRESAAATGTCKTYSGSTLIGTTNFTFTIYAETGSDAAPILDCDAYDDEPTTLALTGDEYTIIPGYSFIYYTIDATAQNGATISSYKATNGTTNRYKDEGYFPKATSPVINFTVTDSRGNTARETITLDVVDYVPLTCNLKSSNMSVAGSMTIEISGNYFNDTFGKVRNTLTVYYRYKEGTGSYGSWIAVSPTVSGNSYSLSKDFTGLNPDSTYVFEARAVDKLIDITSSSSNVQNKPVFDWSGTDFNFNVPVHFGAGATGLEGSAGTAFDGNLEGDLSVSGNAQIAGNLTLKGAGDYGNTLYFGDGNYAYITEAADDELTIHAEKIILDGEVSFSGSGGSAESGSWTPKLASSAISSYSVRDGWYQIVGDVCTLGFLITATANSGYNTSPIEITGFPYEVETRGAGGGTAYNVYTGAGFCFNAWWIDEEGSITGRMVPSNNTAAGNQSITTNCCYPSGGGSMTLSGTICCRIVP